MRRLMTAAAIISAAGAVVNSTAPRAFRSPAHADDLVPTGTLRATFIATDPVQATLDPATGEVRGPANDLAHELGRRLARSRRAREPHAEGTIPPVRYFRTGPWRGGHHRLEIDRYLRAESPELRSAR